MQVEMTLVNFNIESRILPSGSELQTLLVHRSAY